MKYPLLIVSSLFALQIYGQEDIKDQFNPIMTAVTSQSIAADARAASMGDLGAATDPDANSQYWNPSKYAFAYSKAGVSISYTPWLRKLVNDGFVEKVSNDPVIYILTDKGKNFIID